MDTKSEPACRIGGCRNPGVVPPVGVCTEHDRALTAEMVGVFLHLHPEVDPGTLASDDYPPSVRAAILDMGPIHWACSDCGAGNVAVAGAPTYPATCAGCGVRWAPCPSVDCWCDLDDCPICSGAGLVRAVPAVRAAVAA